MKFICTFGTFLRGPLMTTSKDAGRYAKGFFSTVFPK